MSDRADFYGITYQGFGEVFFDGSYHVREENPDQFVKSFTEAIEFQKGYTPPYDLTVKYNIIQDQGSVDVSIFASDTPPAGDNHLFLVITEDSLQFWGNYYNHVTRMMLPDWGGMPVKIGYAESLETTFTFINKWKVENLSVIGFIQNLDTTYDRHVLQSDIGENKGD